MAEPVPDFVALEGRIALARQPVFQFIIEGGIRAAIGGDPVQGGVDAAVFDAEIELFRALALPVGFDRLTQVFGGMDRRVAGQGNIGNIARQPLGMVVALQRGMARQSGRDAFPALKGALYHSRDLALTQSATRRAIRDRGCQD